jgi:hypothetical protein
VKERTEEDLRGLVVELVAVDESGRDQLSSLEQPEVQKLKSIFSHQNLDLADTITKVRTMLLCAEVHLNIGMRVRPSLQLQEQRVVCLCTPST